MFHFRRMTMVQSEQENGSNTTDGLLVQQQQLMVQQRREIALEIVLLDWMYMACGSGDRESGKSNWCGP